MIEKLRTLNAIYQFRGNSPAVQDLKTKQDYLKLAEALCRPLVHYYDSDDSVVHFHERFSSNYSDQEAAFECFSRPLWAMAALVKSGDKELGKTVCAMIKNGVNPQLDTYWGSLRDYAQTIVEIPAICFFLFVNAELFEAEFDAEERKFVIDWLQQINHVKVWNNNWHFFR